MTNENLKSPVQILDPCFQKSNLTLQTSLYCCSSHRHSWNLTVMNLNFIHVAHESFFAQAFWRWHTMLHILNWQGKIFFLLSQITYFHLWHILPHYYMLYEHEAFTRKKNEAASEAANDSFRKWSVHLHVNKKEVMYEMIRNALGTHQECNRSWTVRPYSHGKTMKFVKATLGGNIAWVCYWNDPVGKCVCTTLNL